jgi:glycosyltransferase involved in cell wall biosynthesis
VSVVYRRVSRLSTDHPLRRSWRYLRRISWVRRATDRLLGIRPGGIPAAAVIPVVSAGSVSTRVPSYTSLPCAKAFFVELLGRASKAAPAPQAVPRRVLLVNAGLAAGGAERQIVNTLNGLSGQSLESVAFLGEHLFESTERTFLLPELRSGIAAAAVQRRTRLAEAGFTGSDTDVAELLGLMPAQFVEEILDLTAEFRDRRPEVLHAWQDSTSIKCGIAAVLAGVPRIVLSSRNVNPSNFAYHQPYMRPAYQALAERPNVVLINNSEAGAADFCRWLGLPRERYQVVRNGVALDDLKPDPQGARLLRQRENIPQDALVVGSIFRFWPEKRPLLWLEIAALLLAERPRLHFLLAGDGLLRKEMLTFIEDLPNPKNVHLIAPTHEIGPILSAMNIFLLTSQFEGMPNVVLEAEWLGLPVVAMEAGGVAEAVAAGESAIVCKDESPSAAAAHVCEMIDDPHWSDRARAVGPRFVRERFGLGRMIEETMALYGYARY